MKNSKHKAPAGLSAKALAWWKRIIAENQIDDAAGLLLLETALQAFDRMSDAQAVIEKHGSVCTDRFGQLRANPATTVERDSRAAMLSALKALNLDLEPLNPIGRPPNQR